MATTAARTQSERYTKVAIWLHLLIGAAVVTNIGLAMLTEDMSKATHTAAMAVHKPLGITILVLTLARIAWRLTHTPPPLPAATPAWQRPLSKLVHFTFYALLLLLPLSGWVWMSAAKAPISYYGLFDLPLIAGPSKTLAGTMHEGHEVMGIAMLVLVVIHLLAALKHQYFDRTQLMSRMSPFA